MKWMLFFLLLGCAQVTSLNLKKHQFGILPTKIIWFQIAGLEEEHLAMLRFQQSGETRTAFEEGDCIGKTWDYNLYDLRTKAEASFLAQLTGKKNIKLNCQDASLRPIWSYLNNNGYNTGIIENGASSTQSLTSMNQCGEEGVVFLSSLYFWSRQEPPKNSESFLFQQSIPLKANQIFYDRTCNAKSCFSTFTDITKSVYNRFRGISQKHMLIVRDFSYLAALEKKDFLKAKEILSDIEKSVAYANDLAKSSSDYLVLVTTGESRFVDMPDQGKGWYDFVKNGSHAQAKRARLTNLLLATGSRAENFCGMYEDAEIMERILSGPKQQGLELKIINPFK
ncbi:MAG: hypothetical protein AB7I27_05565 [Bacteriovoracaceae bacterium]